MSSNAPASAEVLACPDPERCRGHRFDRSVFNLVAPGVYDFDPSLMPCPVASELHALREEPVGPRALQIVATADVTRLTPHETADLLRISARATTWMTQRRDDVAVGLADLAAPIKLHCEDGPVLVAEPGSAEVGIALHLSPGSAKALLRRTRARRVRAPKLVDALRRGDSSHQHAWEVDKACSDLSDEAAAAVADACGRVLVVGTKQQAAKKLADAVTQWRCEHPEPVVEPLPGEDPVPESPRERRSVESFASEHPGLAYVLMLLPTETAAALMARLEEGARLLKAAGDRRTGACQMVCVRAEV